jgi:hypothetical protein
MEFLTDKTIEIFLPDARRILGDGSRATPVISLITTKQLSANGDPIGQRIEHRGAFAPSQSEFAQILGEAEAAMLAELERVTKELERVANELAELKTAIEEL